jgi:hypothetical protein
LERETATTSAPKLANRLASSRPIPAVFKISVSACVVETLICAEISWSVYQWSANISDSYNIKMVHIPRTGTFLHHNVKNSVQRCLTT